MFCLFIAQNKSFSKVYHFNKQLKNYSQGQKSRTNFLFWVVYFNYTKNNGEKDKITFFCKILLSAVSHKTRKAFRKLFILSDFVEFFSLFILIKKTYWISSRNDEFIVKIWNTIVNISVQINDKILIFFSKDAPWKALQKL